MEIIFTNDLDEIEGTFVKVQVRRDADCLGHSLSVHVVLPS